MCIRDRYTAKSYSQNILSTCTVKTDLIHLIKRAQKAHLVFIVATPEYNTGVVSKATDHMPHFCFNIGKEVLNRRETG